MQGWKEKLLSSAAKEVLIKSILQVIPTYAMSLFLLPQGLCDEISSLCKRFWWGQQADKKGLMWHKWRDICKPKCQGGLGFRDIEVFNFAMLAKQGWRLLTNPDSLAANVLKAKYFPTCSFLDAKLGSRPSYVWRSLLEARGLLEEGIR